MGTEKQTTIQAEKVEGYQAYYQDAAGHSQFEIIPMENKESYTQTFANELPTEIKYSKWKENHKVQVIKEASAQTVGNKTSREGYKFTPECGKEIYDYLNTRPMIEVEEMIFHMFENPKDPNPFITKEGVQSLTKYLQEVCPRIDAKRIIELLANGGLEKFILKPIEKQSENENTDTAQAQ